MHELYTSLETIHPLIKSLRSGRRGDAEAEGRRRASPPCHARRGRKSRAARAQRASNALRPPLSAQACCKSRAARARRAPSHPPPFTPHALVRGLVCHEGEEGVPAEVREVNLEHLLLQRHEREIDELERGPDGAVGEVGRDVDLAELRRDGIPDFSPREARGGELVLFRAEEGKHAVDRLVVGSVAAFAVRRARRAAHPAARGEVLAEALEVAVEEPLARRLARAEDSLRLFDRVALALLLEHVRAAREEPDGEEEDRSLGGGEEELVRRDLEAALRPAVEGLRGGELLELERHFNAVSLEHGLRAHDLAALLVLAELEEETGEAVEAAEPNRHERPRDDSAVQREDADAAPVDAERLGRGERRRRLAARDRFRCRRFRRRPRFLLLVEMLARLRDKVARALHDTRRDGFREHRAAVEQLRIHRKRAPERTRHRCERHSSRGRRALGRQGSRARRACGGEIFVNRRCRAIQARR
jgi:hypothetical protein